MIKQAWQIDVGNTINGQPVIGKGRVGNNDAFEFNLMVMDKDGYITLLTVSGNTEIMVDDCMAEPNPILKWGGEIKLNPKWNGEIAIGKPSYCDLVWHRTSDVLPIIDGRYLICTGVAMWPVIAHICVCRPDVIWSRLIKGTHERIDTDEVYWWAEIPLPREKS